MGDQARGNQKESKCESGTNTWRRVGEMGDQPTKGQTRSNCKESKWVTNQKESKCESGTICKEDEREMVDQPRGTKS